VYATLTVVPATEAPWAGVVMINFGGLETVTMTSGASPVLPAASRTRADSRCVVLAAAAVFHGTEYGLLRSSAPSDEPSRRN
jgi:hypothetical protein